MLHPKKPQLRKKRPRTPTPEPVDVPHLDDVVLNASAQKDLEMHYQNVGGTSPQIIRFPRNDAFPNLQLVPRPTDNVTHGSHTKRMVAALKKMDEADASCDRRFKDILAREPPVSHKSSLLYEPPAKKPAAKKPRNAAKPPKTPSNAKSKPTSAPGPTNPAGGEVFSLLSPEPEPRRATFGQDDDFDDDSDFDLIDPSELFSSARKKA